MSQSPGESAHNLSGPSPLFVLLSRCTIGRGLGRKERELLAALTYLVPVCYHPLDLR